MVTFISTPNYIDFLMPTYSIKGCSEDNLRLDYLCALVGGQKWGKRDRNINEKNSEQLPLARLLLGIEPTTQAHALTRNQTSDFHVYGIPCSMT